MKQLDMKFNYTKIPYSSVHNRDKDIIVSQGQLHNAVVNRLPNERVADAMLRIYNKNSGLTHRIAYEDKVFPTEIAGHMDIWTEDGNHPGNEDIIHVCSFPEDYVFTNRGGASPSIVSYVCGMSVPPLMLKRIVTRLIESGVFDEDIKS